MQQDALTNIENESNYFDFDNAFSARELPIIKKLQDNAKNESTNPALLDKDISDWLSQQDHHTKTQVHDMINDLVRHVMDLKTVQA